MKFLPSFDEVMTADYFFVDIDNTLVRPLPGVMAPEKLLHDNFLFPIFHSMMVERGWDSSEAAQAIYDVAHRVTTWDYPDFIAEFDLPPEETFRRMHEWHRLSLEPREDGVALVHRLFDAGKKLFIMSNNPYTGCLFKLQVAGLADNDFFSPYFQRIFGTTILGFCKNHPIVWKKAIAYIPAPASSICTVGDSPSDDLEIPHSMGISKHILLE